MVEVVILGAGFGGLMAARQLQSLRNVQITIINHTADFTFIPRLTELVDGSLQKQDVLKPLHDMFDASVSIVEATASSVNVNDRHVKTNRGDIPYDYLVVSTGAKTNFFGTPGSEHCLEFKNYADVVKLKDHVTKCIEQYLENDDTSFLKFAIIGGGFTGVELVVALKEFVFEEVAKHHQINPDHIELHIIQRGDSILPGFDDSARKRIEKVLDDHRIIVHTKTGVTAVEHDTVVCDSQKIKAQTIVWTAGISPNLIPFDPAVELQKNGSVGVSPFLSIPMHDSVYVIGDSALVHSKDERVLPTAQAAFQEGVHAGRNIRSRIFGKDQKEFVYHNHGTLIVLGKEFSMMISPPVRIGGKLGRFFRNLIYKIRWRQLCNP